MYMAGRLSGNKKDKKRTKSRRKFHLTVRFVARVSRTKICCENGGCRCGWRVGCGRIQCYERLRGVGWFGAEIVRNENGWVVGSRLVSHSLVVLFSR
jgi:hypothetical protein